METFNRIIRVITVITLVATVVVATAIFLFYSAQYIEYCFAVSLANDAPIYGSTAADLAVIEKQYSDVSLMNAILSGIQALLAFLFAKAAYRFISPEEATVVSKGTPFEEEFHIAESTQFMREFEEAFSSIERSD